MQDFILNWLWIKCKIFFVCGICFTLFIISKFKIMTFCFYFPFNFHCLVSYHTQVLWLLLLQSSFLLKLSSLEKITRELCCSWIMPTSCLIKCQFPQVLDLASFLEEVKEVTIINNKKYDLKPQMIKFMKFLQLLNHFWVFWAELFVSQTLCWENNWETLNVVGLDFHCSLGSDLHFLEEHRLIPETAAGNQV